MSTKKFPQPTGRKDDQEKDRWDLLPAKPVQALVQVLTHGARKYGVNNWKIVPEAKDRYYAALQRHIHAWRTGEMFDPETNIYHLAHAGTCLIFLLAFDIAEFEGGEP